MNAPAKPNSYAAWPDAQGRFGDFGGRYVAETLMPLVLELDRAYAAAKADPGFQAEVARFNAHYSGRPSPLYLAERLTEHFGGARIYFKRDELNHTGSHKINNTIGQILLARRMGKTRIIAETGAGSHGVATATVCARFGLPCVIYMGATDVDRQAPNVFRMKLLGAEVRPVTSGTGTLKDSMNEAMRDWVTNVEDTYYLIGTAAGPHPYPAMVRDFQSVIGREAREQVLEAEGRLPDALVACIGGGSNAIGLFPPLPRRRGRAAGRGGGGGPRPPHRPPRRQHERRTPRRAARQPHLPLADADGQITDAHSISAGLDYPGVGPEHAWLKESGPRGVPQRHRRGGADAFQLCARLEGILPALEPAHALARVGEVAREVGPGGVVVMNLCGRGDKDIYAIADHLDARLQGAAAVEAG